MKTFQEFLEESISRQHQQIKLRLMQLLNKHKDSPEKREIYKDMLAKYIEKQKPEYPDYYGRENARKDKYLNPSNRPSSFPELSSIPTPSKSPKKIKKQKALGEFG